MNRRIPELMRRGGRGGRGGVGGVEALVSMPTSDLVWGMDARQGITTDGSGYVSAWASQGTSGSDGAQSTPTLRPEFSAAGGPGGLPCVLFGADATNTNTALALSAAVLSASGPVTMYAVISRQAMTARQYLLDCDGTRRAILASVATTASQPGWYDGGWRRPGASIIGVDTWFVLTYRLRNAGGEAFAGSTSVGTNTYAEGLFDGTISLGSEFNDATLNGFHGKLAGIFLYAADHDATAQAMHRGVVNGIWGV